MGGFSIFDPIDKVLKVTVVNYAHIVYLWTIDPQTKSGKSSYVGVSGTYPYFLDRNPKTNKIWGLGGTLSPNSYTPTLVNFYPANNTVDYHRT